MHQQLRTIDPPGSPNSSSRSAQVSGVSGRIMNPTSPPTASVPGESWLALLRERRDSLAEVCRCGSLLLDLGLELKLICHVLVEPPVELPLGSGVRTGRAFGHFRAQRLRLAGQLVVQPDLVDQPPLERLRRIESLA